MRAFPQQEPPFSIQIEPCEGCNLACDFCGIHGIRKTGTPEYRTFKKMTLETADRIARLIHEAGWNPRIEFAMHGEPTLNGDLALIIGRFRAHNPKTSLMCTSNGMALLQDPDGRFLSEEKALHVVHNRLMAFFNNGLNCFALDNYAYLNNRVARVVRALKAEFESAGIRVCEYPADGSEANPNKRRGAYEKIITIIADITETKQGTHSTSHMGNHCGSAAPLSDRLASRPCARPFREIDFRWDGSVVLCCNDWRGEYVIGNIHAVAGVEELWQSDRMNAMRARLLRGNRDVRPCEGCTHRSFREGLLPDHKGTQKAEYPEPHPEDERIIAESLAEGPLTQPVLRPWETPQGV